MQQQHTIRSTCTLGVSVSVSRTGGRTQKNCVERLQAMMLARKLPYFNTKTLTLNLENLELGEGFKDFPFILFKSCFLFLFEFLDFITCNDEIKCNHIKKDF
jgi:hypothetical protein